MSSLRGKVIAVTGAASGIGRATVSILCSHGASLALADISSSELETFASSLPNSKEQTVTSTKVDVTDTKQVNEWIEKVVQDFGRLDGSANIAGIVKTPVSIQNMSDDDYEQVMAVNAGGVFKCLRAQLKHLSSGGSIVNVASVAGLIGFPELAAYVASKHAVIGLTKTAAKEVGSRRIRVNAVAPGMVDTPMTRAANLRTNESGEDVAQPIVTATPLGRVGQPEEVGRLIAWLLSDEASYVNAEVVRVDGGLAG